METMFAQGNPTRQDVQYIVPVGQRQFGMIRSVGIHGGDVYHLEDMATWCGAGNDDVITVPPTPIEYMATHAGIVCDRRIKEEQFGSERRGFKQYRFLLNGHEPLPEPWRQAGIEHLLAYGGVAEQLPPGVQDTWVVALGSPIKVFGRIHVPMLHRDPSTTQIRLFPLDELNRNEEYSQVQVLAVAPL